MMIFMFSDPILLMGMHTRCLVNNPMLTKVWLKILISPISNQTILTKVTSWFSAIFWKMLKQENTLLFSFKKYTKYFESKSSINVTIENQTRIALEKMGDISMNNGKWMKTVARR